MKRLLSASVVLYWLVAAPLASAQGVQVNRENRTIAVTITETVEVDPEVAIVQIGYHNFGPERDITYKQNARVAQQIVDALLAAGVKKESIETGTVNLGRVDSAGKQWTEKQRQERQFEVDQTWNVRVLPAEAQSEADRAVGAGANELQDVSWTVADSTALDARASDAALAKARDLAEKMAQTFGDKVGKLLFVSNSESNARAVLDADSRARGFGNNYAPTMLAVPPPHPILKLFPQKIRRDASVYAVFALE
jgi:uncharacterized protein YggE